MIPHRIEFTGLRPVEAPENLPRIARLPWRMILVGGIALGLGLAILAASGAAPAPGDAAVLGMLAVGAAVGSRASTRLAREQRRQPGGWMTVTIEVHGPTETSGATLIPPEKPRSDPERRSLERLARGRKGRRREPVAVGAAD